MPIEKRLVDNVTRLEITIDSPQKGQMVVGDSPGVPVRVSGSVNVVGDAVASEVTVRLGGSIVEPAVFNDPTWTYSGVTRVGGPVTIIAKVTGSTVPENPTTPPEPLEATKSIIVIPDTIPPVVKITSPSNGTSLPGTNQGVTFDIVGNARDDDGGVAVQTGVKLVEWALRVSPDDKSPFVAVPQHSADWSSWSATVTIPREGSTTIAVRAWDFAGKLSKEDNVTVAVKRPYQVSNLSPLAYLKDLLDFAESHITTSAGGLAVTTADLESAFFQPFVHVSSDAEVAQIRICIEVLRKYLGPNQPDARLYCQTAYETLLRQAGTSYDEVRLSRSADSPTRLRFAIRLGIDVNHLSELCLNTAQMTEDKLEKLFGLRDSNRNPLDLISGSDLMSWRLEYLRSAWKAEDATASKAGSDQPPLVDPDLVPVSALGRAAVPLWNTRNTWIQGELSKFENDRVDGETVQARFDRIVASVLGTPADLLVLDDKRKKGNDISGELRKKQLTLPAFNFLLRIRSLAGTQLLLESEWQDLYSVLTQVQKLRLFATWRAEESTAGLLLDARFFSTFQGAAEIPAWRGTEQGRRIWLDILQARIDQENTVKQAAISAVDSTEGLTLPLLRSILLAAIASRTPQLGTADVLTERLLIDVDADASITTTRIGQAIETIQSVLLSLRAERFPKLGQNNPVASWTLSVDIPDFDLEISWMGSYDTWRAAMFVFLYPENLLLPSLSTGQTDSFKDPLLKRLADTAALTPAQARELAQKYLDDLRAKKKDELPASLKDEKVFKITELMDKADLPKRAEFQKTLYGSKDLRTAPPYLNEIFYFVPMQLAFRLQQSGEYTKALDWYRSIYAYDLPLTPNEPDPHILRKIFYGLVPEHGIKSVFERTLVWLREGLTPHHFAVQRRDAYTRSTITTITRCLLQFADAEFSRDTGESISRARNLYLSALDLIGDLPIPEPGLPPSRTPDNLRLQALVNLAKIRQGRNVAGMQRQVGAMSTSSSQPTPYRYSVLIDRAKQLTGLAQQAEAALLSAYEKHDAEAYSMLRAKQDLGLAQATVQLQELRIIEAADAVDLSVLQTQKAQVQVDHYQDLIDADLIGAEKASLDLQWAASGLDVASAYLYVAASVQSAPSLMAFLSSGAAVTENLAAASANLAQQARTQASIQATLASYERHREEWRFGHDLALQDVRIGQQQVKSATDHKAIVTKERDISRVNADHAQMSVNFLANKFTNAELYAWMSDVLSGVYRYFLQQATAMARLAQDELAFERQSRGLSFIQTDYWRPADGNSNESDGTDRRGLTGSVRLLEDIVKLDEYAFARDVRQLNVIQTFSLPRLDPLGFQKFRETGIMSFVTSLGQFDQRYPGQYLRLIKNVRISVIALIPPIEGIKATLSGSGVSRAVVYRDAFEPVTLVRNPQLIAISSPLNATGVFELDVQSGMLRPFEGWGVETAWTLEMPKASNPFDFNTIADVLITIDYTAFHSADYRHQVIRQLNRTVSSERAFSFRQQFPDQWYALNNPEQSSTPMVVNFPTRREDFPPNVDLDQLKIQQLALYFVRGAHLRSEIEPSLHFVEEPRDTAGREEPVDTPVGGAARSIVGVISTRRGNAASWMPIIGKWTIGTWTLTLPNTPDTIKWFQDKDGILDILFNITYSGTTAPWPT